MPPRAFRAPRPFRALAALLLVAMLGAPSCTSDHGALARRPGGAGTGAASGAAGDGGTAGGGSGGVSGSTGSSGNGGGGGEKNVEPRGRSVTTLVHGIVDAERVAWCFARGEDFFGDPEPREGLRYGGSLSFEDLGGVDLEEDDVSLYALTGELELVAELDCEDAVRRAREEMALAGGGSGGNAGAGGSGPAGAGGEGGAGAGGVEAGSGGAGFEAGASGQAGEGPADEPSGIGGAGGETSSSVAGAAGEGGAGGAGEAPLPTPPKLRVARVVAFPAGSLRDGYSLLMVAAGCIGGPAFSDELEAEVCGAGYSPRQGNVTPELVVLSRRKAPGALSFQALHASRGSGDRGVRVVPPSDEVLSTIGIADGLREGTLRPREPRIDLGPNSYGTERDDYAVQVNQTGAPQFEESWADLLERSGLEAFEGGRGYTLIILGPGSNLRARKWWNGPVLTVVDNDPGGESSEL